MDVPSDSFPRTKAEVAGDCRMACPSSWGRDGSVYVRKIQANDAKLKCSRTALFRGSIVVKEICWGITLVMELSPFHREGK